MCKISISNCNYKKVLAITNVSSVVWFDFEVKNYLNFKIKKMWFRFV